MLAVIITAVCTLVLTLFAFQTKIDFTMSGGILLCALTCLCMFSLLAIFIKNQVCGGVSFHARGALSLSLCLLKGWGCLRRILLLPSVCRCCWSPCALFPRPNGATSDTLA